MYCTDVITKEKAEECINFTFSNKDNILNLLNTINSKTLSHEDHEKILFLLYIEKIGYDYFTNDTPAPAKEYLDIFKNPYLYIPQEFVRDYITEYNLFTYANNENIQDQLDIIYSELNQNEINFLTANNIALLDLIRIRDQQNMITHAPIESNISKYNDILNGKNDTAENVQSEIFKSILKKISMGTIN